jgi:hypothetical protein
LMGDASRVEKRHLAQRWRKYKYKWERT